MGPPHGAGGPGGAARAERAAGPAGGAGPGPGVGTVLTGRKTRAQLRELERVERAALEQAIERSKRPRNGAAAAEGEGECWSGASNATGDKDKASAGGGGEQEEAGGLPRRGSAQGVAAGSSDPAGGAGKGGGLAPAAGGGDGGGAAGGAGESVFQTLLRSKIVFHALRGA